MLSSISLFPLYLSFRPNLGLCIIFSSSRAPSSSLGHAQLVIKPNPTWRPLFLSFPLFSLPVWAYPRCRAGQTAAHFRFFSFLLQPSPCSAFPIWLNGSRAARSPSLVFLLLPLLPPSHSSTQKPKSHSNITEHRAPCHSTVRSSTPISDSSSPFPQPSPTMPSSLIFLSAPSFVIFNTTSVTHSFIPPHRH